MPTPPSRKLIVLGGSATVLAAALGIAALAWPSASTPKPPPELPRVVSVTVPEVAPAVPPPPPPPENAVPAIPPEPPPPPPPRARPRPPAPPAISPQSVIARAKALQDRYDALASKSKFPPLLLSKIREEAQGTKDPKRLKELESLLNKWELEYLGTGRQ